MSVDKYPLDIWTTRLSDQIEHLNNLELNEDTVFIFHDAIARILWGVQFRGRAEHRHFSLSNRTSCSGVVLSHRSKLLISITGRNMSFTGPSVAASAGRTVRRSFDFGRTYVVRPKGKHQATIVWLHGLGDNGNSWSSLLETVPLPNIKWICPTAPQQPVTLFGGFPSTAWFDVNDLSENAHDDIEGLEASATHVASLLANEPADIKLGVGGFSMGAATALYSATCFTRGKFENGNQFSPNLSAVVGLSGWLPCAKFVFKQCLFFVKVIDACFFPFLTMP
ncbi:hypothetical protein ACS0TY_024570 [Phlomoides rotata]